MNDFACKVFLDLIYLAVRMMPIFICLEPRYGNREKITAVSVYLWGVMIAMRSVSNIDLQTAYAVQGVFAGLFFLVLLVFFDGGLLEKAFLYLSAWLFAVAGTSLNELAAWFLRGHVRLSYWQICVCSAVFAACGFFFMVWLWLKNRMTTLFSQLSTRGGVLLLAYPAVFLAILFGGRNTFVTARALYRGGIREVLFFLALCGMVLVLYVMIVNSILETMDRKRTQDELTLARQLIARQREYYNQTLEHIEQIRIIKHDFRHHIHALLHMEREAQMQYLKSLQQELDTSEGEVFCQNQAVNGLLKEYAARTKRDGIAFSVQMDLSAHVPIDDLTLCIVTGNLLENALEACRRMHEKAFINVRGRWMEDHLMMLVENSYSGQIRKSGDKILSGKKDGGLGILSIRRMLNQPGDDFELCYNGHIFTAMVKIGSRMTLKES